MIELNFRHHRSHHGGRLMSSRKLNEIASDVDDASTVVDEIQAEPDADPREKLDELKKTLEDAADTLDELSEENTE